ncbi:MAG: ABC transporter ATP-binding protein [Paracoccaceae bacterium]
MIKINNLSSGYDNIQILKNINLEVLSGNLTTVIGPNGAGKSTLLRTISGLTSINQGTIVMDGVDIGRLRPDEIVELGIIHVPEGRMILSRLTVRENLIMGSFKRKDDIQVKKDLEKVLDMFPILSERINQYGGTLSGGEQQMLAIGRGIMAKPKLLMLDEPSLGIAPIVVEQIFDMIKEVQKEGVTILMVEQNAAKALTSADTGYVLELGSIEASGIASELLNDEAIKKSYLGI